MTRYTAPDITLVGAEHVRRYQETNGSVGHDWNGVRTLVLTTTGHRSGRPRHSAMIYGRDGSGYVVIASQAGLPTHPNWYHNLTSDPAVQIQVGNDRMTATAHTATGAERDRLWSVMTELWPNFDAYQSRTDRVIPVVVLQPDESEPAR